MCVLTGVVVVSGGNQEMAKTPMICKKNRRAVWRYKSDRVKKEYIKSIFEQLLMEERCLVVSAVR